MNAEDVFMGKFLGPHPVSGEDFRAAQPLPGIGPACDQERGRDNGPAQLDQLGSLKVQRACLVLIVGAQLIAQTLSD
jgi:hypothetical protein